MTARRILDAAAIFKAARAVASKHAALRRSQLDVYSKTSTLETAVKTQTDRVTLTVKAASALAERFNAPGTQYSTQASQSGAPTEDSPNPSKAGVKETKEGALEKEGISQDHFHERSEGNTTLEPPPESSLGVKQEEAKIYPPPDGSISPAGGNAKFSMQETETYCEVPPTESAKEPLTDEKQTEYGFLQPTSSGRTSIPEPSGSTNRLSPDQEQKHEEKQWPSQFTKPPPAATSDPEATAIADTNESKLKVDQDQDAFLTRSSSSSSALPTLPRIKVPKNTADAQESDEHVPDAQMSQDIFYSSTSERQGHSVPTSQAVPEQEQLSDETFSGIFHSPRVARMLGGEPKKDNRSQGLELPAAMRTPTKVKKSAQEKDQVSSSLRRSTQGGPNQLDFSTEREASTSKGEDDVHNLAADIAKDAESISAGKLGAPKDLEEGPTKAPYEMRESRVPSSRFGRIWQYGGLAASMTFGAVGESLRRATRGGNDVGGSLMLSAANMERLVAKLSRMRGAALKLGQMMSFQDSKMLPGPINEVLQRVQDSADYMPASQRNKVLANDLGADWRDLFSSFDEKPIAAASIGQVHSANLKSSGQRVAVKVQYPGVASSIDSDLSNLSILLTASRLLPKGLYLDKTIANARTELAWECDYVREAEMGERFRQLLADETDIFHVPAIIKEASGPHVLTADFCDGIGVTKVQNCSQEQKDWIGSNILRLCLREITEFKFMQTDPNWTNFLFNAATNKLELLDFGASRDFPDKFIDPYIRILLAASCSDRGTVRDLSIQLGYLTGRESQAMLNAHVNSVLTLAEPFMETAPEVYDFRDQTITDRVRGFIPVMMRERLAPPPEETYSLHRKLSGAFLLCARLGSRIRCREMFRNAMGKAGTE